MNDLQIFNHPDFGEVRTVTINDEPWFVGKDVAEKLGYQNSKDALISQRERTGLACRPQVDRLQKEPITAVMSAWLVVRLCNPCLLYTSVSSPFTNNSVATKIPDFADTARMVMSFMRSMPLK